MKKIQYNVIGCGGLSLGFEHAGYNLLLGIDMWEDALVTYRYNHKNGNTLCADLANLKAETVEKKIGNQKVDVIIGGPPCLGFSIAGKRIVDDERNSLYKSFTTHNNLIKLGGYVVKNNKKKLTDQEILDELIKDYDIPEPPENRDNGCLFNFIFYVIPIALISWAAISFQKVPERKQEGRADRDADAGHQIQLCS